MGKKILNSASVPPEDCVFCKIVAHKLPSYSVYEDENYVAFLDTAPFSEGHTLVCPKQHGEIVWDMDEEEIGGLFTLASRISKAVVSAMDADGFRFVQNNGEAANQVVAHVHVHVIPVMLADRGRFMDRKKFTPEEMKSIAARIKGKIADVA
jgi:histidine triad (HIT) family protein